MDSNRSAGYSPRRLMLGLGMAAGVATLSACYVVPIGQHPSHVHPVTVMPLPATPVTFSARLYPANELAQVYGMVNAIVTNDLNGRGTFNTAIHGESFVGEATRRSGAPHGGVANGAGNKGGFINCQYNMNSATQGSGTCQLSNGAQFTMHVGH